MREPWWLQAWDELVMLPSSESCCSSQHPTSATGRPGMHVSSIALVALLQAQLSPVASRRQPWPACCMTRQAAAEPRSPLPGSACGSFSWCGIHLLAVPYPDRAGWSIGSRAWLPTTGASTCAAKSLTCCPAAVLQRTDAELGRLLQGLGKQQDSLQPLHGSSTVALLPTSVSTEGHPV